MASQSWEDTSLYTIDYIIMILFLLISMVIGVYFGVIKKQRTTEEYLMGNRQMQLVPVALSLLVTFQSAISVMGTPMDVYLYDSMIFHIHVGMCCAYAVQYFLLVPLLHPLKLTSVYEYLGRRFDSRIVQLLGTYIGMFQTVLYMAVVLFAPALALEAVAGIPLWMSVVVIGIIGTIYTSLGGIKSVIWTDVFQFILLYGGLTVILVMGGTKTGSFGTIIDIAKAGGRWKYDRYSFDPRVRHTLWSLIIGGMFNWLPTCCNQSSVQRICAMRTEKEARRAVLLTIPLMLIYGAILVLTGTVLYSYFYVLNCDPLEAGFINNSNQIVPYFVMHVLSNVPGLAGIFVAALFSGTLSSLSSGINSLAANTIQDILVNYLEGALQVKKTLFAKIIVCFYGAITIGIAYGIRELSGPVTQIAQTAFGACGGPVVGMMFLGAIFPQANWIGAFAGGLVGMVFNTWLAISCLLYGTKTQKSPPITTSGCFLNTTSAGNVSYTSYTEGVSLHPMTLLQETDIVPTAGPSTVSSTFPLFDISYLYLGLTGLLVTLFVGLLVSLFTGKDRGNPPDPIYLFPCLRSFWKTGYKTVELSSDKEMHVGKQPTSDIEHAVTPLGSPVLSWYDKHKDDEL